MIYFWVFIQKNSVRTSKRYLHSHAHCSIIHNCWDTEENMFPWNPVHMLTYTNIKISGAQLVLTFYNPFWYYPLYSIPSHFVVGNTGPVSFNGFSILLMGQMQDLGKETSTCRAWNHEKQLKGSKGLQHGRKKKKRLMLYLEKAENYNQRVKSCMTQILGQHEEAFPKRQTAPK